MGTLYRYECKKALKLLLIFIAIMTIYVVLIIQMYEPKTMKLLDDYVKVMHAVGMSAGNTSLLALNSGLCLMHFVVAAFVLFISSLALDYKMILLLSAGMPAFMYIMQMLKNTVTKIKVLKYTTIFTLYDTNSLIKLTSTALLKAGVLAILCLAMMIVSLIIFKKRDLSL